MYWKLIRYTVRQPSIQLDTDWMLRLFSCPVIAAVPCYWETDGTLSPENTRHIEKGGANEIHRH